VTTVRISFPANSARHGSGKSQHLAASGSPQQQLQKLQQRLQQHNNNHFSTINNRLQELSTNKRRTGEPRPRIYQIKIQTHDRLTSNSFGGHGGKREQVRPASNFVVRPLH